MAGSVNDCKFIGRLTRDPEVRTFDRNGQQVTMCKFSIAVDRPYSRGGDNDKTDFFDVVVWRKLAEICSQYLHKGKQVYVSGPMYINSWNDKDTGKKRYKPELNANDVVFLGDNSGGGNNNSNRNQNGNGGQRNQPETPDVPF